MSFSEPTVDTPQSASLPELDSGLTLLTAGTSVRQAIHALAVDHVLLSNGEAIWIDPGTHAQTDPLVDVAPSNRILDRIHVARGFTPFQHLELLRSLPSWVSNRTELIVVPHLDAYYRNDGLLADEGRDMLLSGIASLTRVARKSEIPVLVTRKVSDTFSEPIATAASQTIVCDRTPFGPRFSSDETETLVYPTADDRWVQTTLAFWNEVLASRQSLYEQPHGETARAQEVTVHGTN